MKTKLARVVSTLPSFARLGVTLDDLDELLQGYAKEGLNLRGMVSLYCAPDDLTWICGRMELSPETSVSYALTI